MTKGQQQDGPMQRRPRKARSRQPHLLKAHPAFAPILGVWGAALAGLSILVLPAPLVAQLGAGTGIVLLGAQAQGVLAGLAALLLGGALFVIANRMTRKTRRSGGAPSIASLAARRIGTIDPKRELGSASLDEPVAAMPFAAAAPEPKLAPERDSPAAEPPLPRALDLSEFAQLPGRNAVWVEDAPASAEADMPAPPDTPIAPPTPAAETSDCAPSPNGPRSAALARLRAQPPEELGLTQMVERFAGALHEHRAGNSGNRHDFAAREAALAEALKALSVLSGDSDTMPQGEPLRAALTRLQELRGAA